MPCLFQLYAVYIKQSAGLDEVQGKIKIVRRNINKLRNADDTTLMVVSEEELRKLLINVWQKPLQHYKVISLQLIKINGKKR